MQPFNSLAVINKPDTPIYVLCSLIPNATFTDFILRKRLNVHFPYYTSVITLNHDNQYRHSVSLQGLWSDNVSLTISASPMAAAPFSRRWFQLRSSSSRKSLLAVRYVYLCMNG